MDRLGVKQFRRLQRIGVSRENGDLRGKRDLFPGNGYESSVVIFFLKCQDEFVESFF